MRRTTHEYETELHSDGEVVMLGAVAYRGRTVLHSGPDMFAPLERWAQDVADEMRTPVTWRATSDGGEVHEDTRYPG
ncbi:hypothetical protein F4561_004016 [Lipingzhangella halophila]|uniref:Uncharacterized protein n=1 Tax=Lipingzhangella halophila TaxID=1783352 RepID=A0A7W7W3W6_9ACTN|nr:hypothetical protein [Lipingzhangella halophila]MBB4933196.1 hypothetical protein [Lipingzhangella halophila]